MSVPFKVKAVFEYTSPHDDDLNFPNGQIITVTEAEDDDWYTGEYTDASGTKQEGLFPRNFVEKYEPEIPSRPTRPTRPKKETEPPQPPPAEVVPSAAPPVESPVEHDQKDLEDVHQEPEPVTSSEPPPAVALPVEEEAPAPRQAPASGAAKSPPLPTATKPVPSKGPPPPVAEKPSGNSFKDRIAAFNKPSAAPITPFKPGSSSGGSGFIKKPFVAPPPSRNAYVPPPREPPPQKLYRREEDESELTKPPPPPAPKAVEPEAPTEEDQPKPTSLKDRIALLQKQQLEQAARQAEAAQKKEKPKRPPKKRIESQERSEQVPDTEETGLHRVDTSKTAVKEQESFADDEGENVRSPTFAPQVPVASPPPPSRELVSDTNDADDSEDAAALPTGREDDGEKPKLPIRSMSVKAEPAIESASKESDEADEEDEGEEEEGDEDEEDIDPEIKRRMEIRERMAKMSGGMGMMGMFGGSAGMPMSAAPRKSKPSGDSARAPSLSQENDQPASRAPPVPIMALPGMYKTRSPEEAPPEASVEHEEGSKTPSLASSKARDAADVPDIEDVEEPQEDETPAQKSPAQARLPPPPPSRNAPPMTPGEMADDEMSFAASRISLDDSARPQSKEGPPTSRQPPPPPPSVPARRATQDSVASATSPVTPSSQEKRVSRGPPPLPPTAAPVSSPQTRAPPPPPPGLPSRTGSMVTGKHQGITDDEEDEDEVTEYDGDYDTDIAPGAEHKDALKAHERDSSVDEDTPVEEVQTPPSSQPARGPPPLPPSNAPRNVPPPPPTQAPKASRQSSDMPRAAPPPVPPPKEAHAEADVDDYDPFNYSRSPTVVPPRNYPPPLPDVKTPAADDEDMYSAPPMTTRAPPPPPATEEAFPRSSVERKPPPPPTSQAPQPAAPQPPRQSMDTSTYQGGRRSLDQSRPSVEHGFMASDIDIAPSTFWWTQPNLPPPSLQSRKDILYEMESKTSTKRGGKASTTTSVYVLYMDYSQSTISLTFDPSNPSDYSVEQRHERPPPPLRQDQLEAASTGFGSSLASAAESKQNATVGNGTPHALVLELISAIPTALKPVGNRSFGALVYGNLANASVQQFDEIRAGDIVTFRNAKFQGHRGTMHQKYALDLTRSGPDHVGIVVDWDGTKKKIRAWEQGRESKKVKIESFKLGDLRSGECKVWRVMGRKWVGWESGS